MKILFIDGMGSPANIWRELALPLKENNPGLECVYSQWFDWHRFTDKFDAVVGHSLGGDSAVRFSKVNPVRLTVLCGARYQTDIKAASWWDLLCYSDDEQRMVAPNGNTHNFWTHGPLPSAECTGAVENVDVGSIWKGIVHGNCPAAPQVYMCMEKFINASSK